MINRKITSSAMAVILFLCFFNAAQVQAHEPRLVADGMLNIVVGWRSEPAYAGEANNFDLIISDDIDVEDPMLDVTIMSLEEDAQDAGVKSMATLTGDLRRDRENPSRFNIAVLPTKPGAIGFHIKGMINGMMVDEVFICRDGTQNVDGRSFGCIEKIQRFPGGKKSRDHKGDK